MNVNAAGPSATPPVPPQSAGESIPQQSAATSPPPNDAAITASKDQAPAETQETSAAEKPDAAQAKPSPAQAQAPAASRVEVSDILSGKLSELTKTIMARAELISSLPENIQNAIKDIFRQGALTENNLPEGLANLLKSQNIANKQLAVLANLFDDAARLANESQGNGRLTQLLEKLFPDKINTPATPEQQKLADTLVRLNNQDISPGQLRQTLQSLVGELLSQNASLPKGAQQLPQLLFGQNAAPLPPEIVKLAETVKQPDITLLWTILQAGQKENKPLLPEQAQQRLLELANQLIKDQAALSVKSQPAPNPTTNPPPNPAAISNPAVPQPPAPAAQGQQAVQQILSGLLTDEETKLLEFGSLLKNMAGQNATGAPPLLAQMAKDANMPQLLQLWNLTQTLTAGGGRNLTLAAATTVEQNLNQLASNLLAGSISASEAKNSLDILMNSFKGFNRFGAEEEQLAKGFLRQTLTSLPPQVEQAAVKHNLPELRHAWLMTRLANLDACREQAASELKLASTNIRALSSAMQRSAVITPVIEHQSGNSVLSLTTPLYFGDGQAYPAHIHIYQEYADGGSPAARRRKKPETWVRITVDTENIGPVDAFFRLYDQDKLDVRVRFQEHLTASEFGEYLPEIRRAMKDSALELTDLSVRSSNS